MGGRVGVRAGADLIGKCSKPLPLLIAELYDVFFHGNLFAVTTDLHHCGVSEAEIDREINDVGH